MREDFLSTIIDPIYGTDGRANAEHLHSHRLSVFFMVLALGSLYGSSHSQDILAKQYHALARATLSFDSISREVTCATVQALYLVFRFICNSDLDGKEGRWLMTGLCARIAQTVRIIYQTIHRRATVECKSFLDWTSYVTIPNSTNSYCLT